MQKKKTQIQSTLALELPTTDTVDKPLEVVPSLKIHDYSEKAALIRSLCSLPSETEWVEFKTNNWKPDDIGERISALANSIVLHGKERGYIVWGVEDGIHRVVGAKFDIAREKVGNEDLEMWFSRMLQPRLDLRFHTISLPEGIVVLLEITPCRHTPVRWKDYEYIRVGSYTKKLRDFPEKERRLWEILSTRPKLPFEKEIALRDVSDEKVLKLLDYDSYLRLMKHSLPPTRQGTLDLLASEKLILANGAGYDITNLGAILFARNLSDFETLKRKAARVIDYATHSRAGGGREYIENAGYASGFERLVDYIHQRPPNNEYIAQALRIETEMYPRIAIRELAANALIHQDFETGGDSPLIEVFPDRIEISNAGVPLVDPMRFINEPPQSRNETLADLMRRLGICEERGSGIDKVITAVELFQLPPPEFLSMQNHTRVCLYAHRPFQKMTSKERVRACYQHVCLMYADNQSATNTSLRKRFSLRDDEYQVASKIISSAAKENLVKSYDPENRSPRYARYVPSWA